MVDGFTIANDVSFFGIGWKFVALEDNYKDLSPRHACEHAEKEKILSPFCPTCGAKIKAPVQMKALKDDTKDNDSEYLLSNGMPEGVPKRLFDKPLTMPFVYAFHPKDKIEGSPYQEANRVSLPSHDDLDKHKQEMKALLNKAGFHSIRYDIILVNKC